MMKFIGIFLVLLCPFLSEAQTQTKAQCVATLRARSMSISSSDAEKICSEDSADIGNCAITKMQGSHKGGMAEAVKACRSESNWYAPTPTPTPKASATPALSPTVTPTVTPSPSESPASPKTRAELLEEELKALKKKDGKKSEPKGNFEDL